MSKKIVDLKHYKETITAEQLMEMEPAAAERMFNRLGLEAQAALILKTPWARRMDIILMAANSRDLVQALPAEEMYWSIKERGVEDSLALISRTSHEQFQYMIDIDCWSKYEIDADSIAQWYKLLARCNEDKVMEWFLKADSEFLVSSLKHFMRVSKIEGESDYSEEYEIMNTYTIDNINYFNFLHEDDPTFILPLLNTVYQNDRDLFYSIMEGVIWDSALEAEDESFRWRQARVSEKGFPELDEALGVYARLSDQEISRIKARVTDGADNAVRETDEVKSDLLRYTVNSGELPAFIRNALAGVENSELLDDIQKKMICLANKIFKADAMEVRETKDLKRALKKVSGYMNIGLEVLAGKDLFAAVTALERLHPEIIFRAGFSRVLKIKDSAERSGGRLWRHSRDLFSAFMDTPWAEAVRGSVMARPLLYEGIIRAGNDFFRDFEEMDEVLKTEQALEVVRVAESVLFEGFQIPPRQLVGQLESISMQSEPDEIKCSAVFLTVLANHVVKGKPQFRPLGAEELKQFLDRVFTENGQTQGCRLKDNLSHETAAWVAGICRPAKENRPALDRFIGACLRILEKEFSALVSKKTIDKRFVSAILIK